MARGSTFLTLVTMLRAELGRAPSVAVGVDDVSHLKHHLNAAYESRFDEHDWPHLRRTFDAIPLSAGEQYYNFPSDLNYERIEGAWIWFSGRPVPLKRGISLDDYAAYDSTNDVRSAPAMKWDVRSIANAVQFEVWPLPADNAMSVTFLGHRKLAKLVNDIDVCLLDDWLVVFDAAASIEKDEGKRRQRAAKAEKRFALIAANTHNTEDGPRLNLGPAGVDPFKGVTIAVR